MIDKPDIVVRLRDMSGGNHLRSLREEAAAEIERLRIELATARKAKGARQTLPVRSA